MSDPNDLLKLLNLTPANTPDPRADPVVAEAPGAPRRPGKPPSDSALVLDRWDRAEGARLFDTNVKAHATGLDATALADMHGCAFLYDPQPVAACADPRRLAFVNALLAAPECQALRLSTVANLLAADTAAVQFAEQFAKLQRQDEKRQRDPRKGDPARQEQRAPADLMRAAGKAVGQAQADVEELEATQGVLGVGDPEPGIGAGQGGVEPLPVAEVTKLLRRVHGSAFIRKVVDLAGRFIRFAQAKQRTKVHHGYDDMVGVALDDRVEHLLDEELVQLVDPELERDALRRLNEKEMLARQYRGVEKVGKGPIIVCVDESGSMECPVHAPNIIAAKAFALAMVRVAHHQKRWCALVSYSGGTEGYTLTLPPRGYDRDRLLDWVAHFYRGGTEYHVPFDRLPNEYWEQFVMSGMQQGKTDLIVISDGQINIPSHVEDRFNLWKRQVNCRSIGLILGQSDAGGLDKVLDDIHLIKSIDTDEHGVRTAFSI